MTKKRERITDAGIKPPRLIDSNDIAADVERFLAQGGLIDRPAFRQDRLEKSPGETGLTRRRWQINATPPELREAQKRGGWK